MSFRTRSMAIAIIVVAILSPSFLEAQSFQSKGLQFTINDVRFNYAIASGIPIPTGADADIRILTKNQRLFFNVRVAGGYEDRKILRNTETGAPIEVPTEFDAVQWFNWPNLELDGGVTLRNRPAGRSTGPYLDFFVLGRTRYENNSETLATDIFSDANGLLAFSFLGGVGGSTVQETVEKSKSGVKGEFAFEYAPEGLDFVGGTSFTRVTAKVTGYVPLYASAPGRSNGVAMYAAGFFAADYAAGRHVPLYVLTSFGGRLPYKGLGGGVRGYPKWGYEANTKALASAELRLAGPALFGKEMLHPMMYVFGDAGYYSGLAKSLSVEKQGFLFSTGGGLALDVMDYVYLGIDAGYTFPFADSLYTIYMPSGQRFFWDVTFSLHY